MATNLLCQALTLLFLVSATLMAQVPQNLILPGPLLRQLSTESATDPFSEPALVLQFIKPSR